MLDPFSLHGLLNERAQAWTLIHSGQPPSQAWFASVTASDLVLKPEEFLNLKELAELATFRFALRRENFLLGRLAAKLALSALLPEPEWTHIGLTNGVLGQPLVHHLRSDGAEISLSHAGGLAVAVAFPRGQSMGLDLELIDSPRAGTVKNELRILPAEQAWIETRAMDESSAFVLLWTVREALGKALRCGLTCPAELLAVDQIKRRSDGVWESYYHSFQQYRCLSWMRDCRVVSLALPRTFDLERVVP